MWGQDNKVMGAKHEVGIIERDDGGGGMGGGGGSSG